MAEAHSYMLDYYRYSAGASGEEFGEYINLDSNWVDEGLGYKLVLLDETYEFSWDHETYADISAYEVSPVHPDDCGYVTGGYRISGSVNEWEQDDGIDAAYKDFGGNFELDGFSGEIVGGVALVYSEMTDPDQPIIFINVPSGEITLLSGERFNIYGVRAGIL